MSVTLEAIDSSSDDELFALLFKELQHRVRAKRGSADFIAQIRELPPGLRAMAATYELDVSLALDDLGWHFGNCHNEELAEETGQGLEELDAHELAGLFRKAYELAKHYWTDLGANNWMQWYHGSVVEKRIEPLSGKLGPFLRVIRVEYFNIGWTTQDVTRIVSGQKTLKNFMVSQ